MNYDEILKDIQTLGEIPLNQEDEHFKRITPLMFNTAEGRIYRDLDFLAITATLPGVLQALIDEVALPDRVLVLRAIRVIHPIKPTNFDPLKKTPLERVSPEALAFFSEPYTLPLTNYTTTPRPGVPEKYCVLGNNDQSGHVVKVDPPPDQPYQVEFYGRIRPLPISPTNTVTFLSDRYPELLIAACMVFLCGFQRDYGAASDDPQKALSWEAAYGGLRGGIMDEQNKLKALP